MTPTLKLFCKTYTVVLMKDYKYVKSITTRVILTKDIKNVVIILLSWKIFLTLNDCDDYLTEQSTLCYYTNLRRFIIETLYSSIVLSLNMSGYTDVNTLSFFSPFITLSVFTLFCQSRLLSLLHGDSSYLDMNKKCKTFQYLLRL